MSTRRGFLGKILGLVALPVVVDKLVDNEPTVEYAQAGTPNEGDVLVYDGDGWKARPPSFAAISQKRFSKTRYER